MNLLLKIMSYVALITQLKRLYDLPASVPLFSAMFQWQLNMWNMCDPVCQKALRSKGGAISWTSLQAGLHLTKN